MLSKKPEHHPKHLVKAFENFRKIELQEFRDYLRSPLKIFWANFLAGTARGLGFLLGAAIVVTLATYVLKELLGNIPIIGDLALALETWIEETLSKPTLK